MLNVSDLYVGKGMEDVEIIVCEFKYLCLLFFCLVVSFFEWNVFFEILLFKFIDKVFFF